MIGKTIEKVDQEEYYTIITYEDGTRTKISTGLDRGHEPKLSFDHLPALTEFELVCEHIEGLLNGNEHLVTEIMATALLALAEKNKDGQPPVISSRCALNSALKEYVG